MQSIRLKRAQRSSARRSMDRWTTGPCASVASRASWNPTSTAPARTKRRTLSSKDQGHGLSTFKNHHHDSAQNVMFSKSVSRLRYRLTQQNPTSDRKAYTKNNTTGSVFSNSCWSWIWRFWAPEEQGGFRMRKVRKEHQLQLDYHFRRLDDTSPEDLRWYERRRPLWEFSWRCALLCHSVTQLIFTRLKRSWQGQITNMDLTCWLCAVPCQSSCSTRQVSHQHSRQRTVRTGCRKGDLSKRSLLFEFVRHNFSPKYALSSTEVSRQT